MNTRISRLLLPALLLAAPAVTQEPDMSPAKELKRFEPMVGNWRGEGTAMMPDGTESKWTSHATLKWALGNHWLQVDEVVTFEGMDAPLAFRVYNGWDRENGRYVSVASSNEGTVGLQTIEFLPDGTQVAIGRRHRQGTTYAERMVSKVEGDTGTMTIDLLLPTGELMQMVKGTLKRCDDEVKLDLSTGSWMGGPVNENVQRLARMCGTYDIKGELVMFPGQPAMKITGTDAYESTFGGNVMHGVTKGFAEGSPEPYESQAFWAWDESENCIKCVFVDNMGAVGDMECRWVEDKLISTDSTLMMGMPTTQRFVMSFDGNGVCTMGVGHTTMGTFDPFVSFKGKYTRK